MPDFRKFVDQAMTDFESPLIGYANSILNDTDRAREVVQETFNRLCSSGTPQSDDDLKPWLLTTCRGLLREREGGNIRPDLLMGCLGRLSENQREVIILRFQQHLGYRDINRVTGLTPSNISFLTHTALRRLRDILPADPRS